jgi:hypothetical protein
MLYLLQTHVKLVLFYSIKKTRSYLFTIYRRTAMRHNYKLRLVK